MLDEYSTIVKKSIGDTDDILSMCKKIKPLVDDILYAEKQGKVNFESMRKFKRIFQAHIDMSKVLKKILDAHNQSSVDWDAMREAKKLLSDLD